ncbi:kinase-like domain-containing protein [Mycena amicta]|nr:kinase-like domain-containing protein [Mycena amicta]
MSPAKPPLAIVEVVANELYLTCLFQLNRSQHYCSLAAPCKPAVDVLAPFLSLRLVSMTWNKAIMEVQRDQRGIFFSNTVEEGVFYPHTWHINTRVRKSVLFWRYRVFRTIQSEAGNRGVYLAYDLQGLYGCADASEVVLKAWVSASDFELHRETRAYEMLDGCPGVPTPLHLARYDATCDVHVLALPKLGPTLEQLVDALPEKRMSVRMVLTVAIQMLDRYKDIHAKGLMHCGMKPGNICLAPRASTDSVDTLYVIDFGFSVPLADNLSLPSPHRIDVVGNRRFLSVFAHHGISQCQRDDLESLAYLLSFLFHGELPWDRPGTADSRSSPSKTRNQLGSQRHQPQVWRLKIATPATELFCGMDQCFVEFWRDVKGFAYGEVPNYSKMAARFKACLAEQDGEGALVNWWNIWDQSE